jgi:hypothetical protein
MNFLLYFVVLKKLVSKINNYFTNNMKNKLLLFLFCIIILFLNTDFSLNKKFLLTEKYAGTYGYKMRSKEGFGIVDIIPETDSTIFIHFDKCLGYPSYNLGGLYERLKVVNDSATFSAFDKNNPELMDCKWTVHFYINKLIIKTVGEHYECGFGHNVFMDGTYIRRTKRSPKFFIDLDGTKYYYDKTSPDEYNKD